MTVTRIAKTISIALPIHVLAILSMVPTKNVRLNVRPNKKHSAHAHKGIVLFFLFVVMDPLLKKLQESSFGLSLHNYWRVSTC